MYEEFYNLDAKAFSLLPNPAFLYMSQQHAHVMSTLEYAVNNDAALSVVTGDVGAGKTTAIRQLLIQLEQTVTVGLISNTHREFGSLMQSVAMAFGIHFKGKEKVELYQDFTDFLVNEYAAGRRTLLILDEAQNLDAQTLEEVRLLTNINADDHTLLQLLLVGQSELRDLLRRHELRQLTQRINVMAMLGPLNERETTNYIRHRLTRAGGDPKLFHKNALRLIYWNSRGIPRVINLLCELALDYGFTRGKRKIHAQIIADIVHDRAESGVFGELVYDLETLEATDKANALEAAARQRLKALKSRTDTTSLQKVVSPEIRRVGKKVTGLSVEESDVTEISIAS